MWEEGGCEMSEREELGTTKTFILHFSYNNSRQAIKIVSKTLLFPPHPIHRNIRFTPLHLQVGVAKGAMLLFQW